MAVLCNAFSGCMVILSFNCGCRCMLLCSFVAVNLIMLLCNNTNCSLHNKHVCSCGVLYLKDIVLALAF